MLKTVSECVKSRFPAQKTVCGIGSGNSRFLLRRRHFFIFSLADGGGVFGAADAIRKHPPAPDRRHEAAVVRLLVSVWARHLPLPAGGVTDSAANGEIEISSGCPPMASVSGKFGPPAADCPMRHMYPAGTGRA